MAIIDKSFPEISIHALVKRATSDRSYSGAKFVISIHALVKRATATVLSSISKLIISIHALVKRATEKQSFAMTILRFQSTPS